MSTVLEPASSTESTPTVDDPTMPANSSLQATLRARKAAAVRRESHELPINPDWGLWGTFRAMDDFTEMHGIGKRAAKVGGEAQQILYAAADTLVKASLDTFTFDEDGVKRSLGMPLGVELANFMDEHPDAPDPISAARQAAILLFPSTMAIIETLNAHVLWQRGVNDDADEDSLGESEATSA